MPRLFRVGFFLTFAIGMSPSHGQQVFVDPMFGVSITTDIIYGTGDVGFGSPGGVQPKDLRLDLYRPDGPGVPSLLPTALIITGGGFLSSDRQTGEFLGFSLASRGYVAAVIDYRVVDDLLPPEIATLESGFDPSVVLAGQILEAERSNAFAAQINDGKAAIDWLQTNASGLGIAPNRLLVAGFSSGARVALALGFAEATDDIAAVWSILGGIDGQEEFVDPSDPAVVLVSGLSDPVVPPFSSIEVANLADAMGIPYELHLGEAEHDASFYFADDGNGSLYDQSMSFLYEHMNLGGLPGGGGTLPEMSSVTLLGLIVSAAASRWMYGRWRKQA